MILSDRDIARAFYQGDIGIAPEPETIQPASVDIHLSAQFRVFINTHHTHIDPREDMSDLTRQVDIADGRPFILHPDEFVLGSTVEHIALSAGFAARIEGKSSLGRLGLLVHSTAGFVDPGFTGTLTLELRNIAQLPVMLWPGYPIAQLSFYLLSTPAGRLYGDPELSSKYQYQTGPTASRAHFNGQPAPSQGASTAR